MSIFAIHKDTKFGVGDVIRVHQRINEVGSDKSRVQILEGQVISIRGKDMGRSVVVRRIGAQKIGMEFIFPLMGPTIEKVVVSRSGTKGVRSAKLFFTRDKSRKEIEKIFSRVHLKDKPQVKKSKVKSKKTV